MKRLINSALTQRLNDSGKADKPFPVQLADAEKQVEKAKQYASRHLARYYVFLTIVVT